jgi:phosphohistidine phosphatase SixA
MHIFLILHGESVANVGENYVKRLPDHLVPLTEKGKEQARENGKWLLEYCKEKGINLSGARIWRSPYLRTRQTSEEFNKFLNIDAIEIIRLHIALREKTHRYNGVSLCLFLFDCMVIIYI